MRFPRLALTYAVLTVYAVQLLGGPALHLWQCSDATGHCGVAGHRHGDSADERDADHSQDVHAPFHGHCHELADHGDGEPHVARAADAPSDPNDHSSHDSSQCWVCQVLGQAQNAPVLSLAAAGETIAPAAPPASPECYPTPSRSGFDSRAPPVL